MAEKMLDLGQGLEIWKVDVDELREQDINARAMSKPMFDRLSLTIKNDARLETLPFCALTDKGIEIVSGHHRTRALRAAGLRDLFAIVDVTGLSRDKIKAKQLAHNAIQGDDNEQIVKQIYQSIEDANVKLEAFIDKDLDMEIKKVQISDIIVDLNYRTVLLTFLPTEKEYFEEIAEEINKQYDGMYLADKEKFQDFVDIINKIDKEYDIRSVTTALGKMVEISAEYLGKGIPETEAKALRDIFKTAYIPMGPAEVIEQALEKMTEKKEITSKNIWQAIEYWAADYLAGD
ncbi:MAG TPA: ParB N-terminal domain-containing protein [Clostridia bacterium]|nr:ParB N-terminal domain-containing protein [Clostridia bacterium]